MGGQRKIQLEAEITIAVTSVPRRPLKASSYTLFMQIISSCIELSQKRYYTRQLIHVYSSKHQSEAISEIKIVTWKLAVMRIESHCTGRPFRLGNIFHRELTGVCGSELARGAAAAAAGLERKIKGGPLSTAYRGIMPVTSVRLSDSFQVVHPAGARAAPCVFSGPRP